LNSLSTIFINQKRVIHNIVVLFPGGTNRYTEKQKGKYKKKLYGKKHAKIEYFRDCIYNGPVFKKKIRKLRKN